MNKAQAKELVSKQAAFRAENPGPFAGVAPGLNEAQLAIAQRIVAGEEPPDFAADVVHAPHVGPVISEPSAAPIEPIADRPTGEDEPSEEPVKPGRRSQRQKK